MLTLALSAPALRPTLMYDRGRILDGEVWRLLTGALVHAGPLHLAWNVVALALVVVLARPPAGAAGWLVLTSSALGAGLGTLVFAPEVRAMVGLSGVLHGLWAGGGLLLVRRGDRGGGALLALLGVKLLVEALHGPHPLTRLGLSGVVALPAHLFGAFGGLLGAESLAIGARCFRSSSSTAG